MIQTVKYTSRGGIWKSVLSPLKAKSDIVSPQKCERHIHAYVQINKPQHVLYPGQGCMKVLFGKIGNRFYLEGLDIL